MTLHARKNLAPIATDRKSKNLIFGIVGSKRSLSEVFRQHAVTGSSFLRTTTKKWGFVLFFSRGLKERCLLVLADRAMLYELTPVSSTARK